MKLRYVTRKSENFEYSWSGTAYSLYKGLNRYFDVTLVYNFPDKKLW